MDDVVEDMIVLIAVVILGLIIASFSFSYFTPKIAFANAQSDANTMASSISISTGPLIISGGQGSVLFEVYDPSYSYNYTVIAFVEPSSYSASAGLVTPSIPPSTNSFSVYLPSGVKAYSMPLNTVYSLSGSILLTSGTGYTVPGNVPFTVKLPATSSDIVIIWVIYQDGGYNFRVDFAYSGVPST